MYRNKTVANEAMLNTCCQNAIGMNTIT